MAEDEVVINEESDMTELAEKRRRRAPEKYSPTWLMDSDVIAFVQELDAAKVVSEDAHRFIAVTTTFIGDDCYPSLTLGIEGGDVAS